MKFTCETPAVRVWDDGHASVYLRTESSVDVKHVTGGDKCPDFLSVRISTPSHSTTEKPGIATMYLDIADARRLVESLLTELPAEHELAVRELAREDAA